MTEELNDWLEKKNENEWKKTNNSKAVFYFISGYIKTMLSPNREIAFWLNDFPGGVYKWSTLVGFWLSGPWGLNGVK